jgi:hypothetical protein
LYPKKKEKEPEQNHPWVKHMLQQQKNGRGRLSQVSSVRKNHRKQKKPPSRGTNTTSPSHT